MYVMDCVEVGYVADDVQFLIIQRAPKSTRYHDKTFFLMIRGPQRSTLLPDTTLFRSRDHALLEALAAVRRVDRDPHLRRVVAVDRKSTRLNSSHANISYAVFCLKKSMNSSHANITNDYFFFQYTLPIPTNRDHILMQP